MKKFKKISLSLLFILVLLLGAYDVSAKSVYTSYKAGDKITVNVNENTKLDFYVIEDSNSGSDKVTAIYEKVMGELIEYGASDKGYEGSNAQKELNRLTDSWTNVISKRLIKANEVIPDAKLTKNYDENFKSNYLCNGFNYWILDTITDEESELLIPYSVTSWNTYCELSFDVDSATIRKTSYIRPVITIAKENVVGGVTILEEDKVWKDFVEKYKKSELVSEFNAEVEYDDDYMKITVFDEDNNKSWITKFDYADGVISYTPSSDEKEVLFYDSFWVGNCMTVLSEIKGYDSEALQTWFEKQTNLTLAKDGIEFSEEKMQITESGSVVNLDVTFDAYTNFKLDIKNGIKTFKVEEPPASDKQDDNSDDASSNPGTGLFMKIGGTIFVCLSALGLGLCLYLKNRKINNY